MFLCRKKRLMFLPSIGVPGANPKNGCSLGRNRILIFLPTPSFPSLRIPVTALDGRTNGSLPTPSVIAWVLTCMKPGMIFGIFRPSWDISPSTPPRSMSLLPGNVDIRILWILWMERLRYEGECHSEHLSVL